MRASFIPSEDDECMDLVIHLKKLQKEKKIISYGHISNEDSYKRGHRNKLMGLAIGFPDYIIIAPNNKFIFIEMKRRAGSHTSVEQKFWIQDLVRAGAPAQICNGFEEAKIFLEKVL